MKQCNFCEPEPCTAKEQIRDQRKQDFAKIEKWSFIAVMWAATVYFTAQVLVALGVGR